MMDGEQIRVWEMLWLTESTVPIFAQKDWGISWRSLAKTAGDAAEIRTEYLPNTTLSLYKSSRQTMCFSVIPFSLILQVICCAEEHWP